MATTTNYGWTTPDDTALVKDGAAAIRTLGSSVVTTTKNLNPETTLGDLAYRSSTANVKTRLGLGTAGQVLKVNSGATAPEWGSASASFVGASLDNTTTQTVTSPGYTAVTWSVENFDTDGFHSTVSNTSRMTIPAGKGGYYQVNASVRWDDNTTNSRLITLYKNGTIFHLTASPGFSIDPTMNIQAIMYLVATDYVEVYVYQNSGGNRTIYPQNSSGGTFSIGYLGA